MGLDMYAYVTTAALNQAVDFPEPEDCEELHYWRKHPNLHGWMEKLYRAKQGSNEDFNLAPLLLTVDDLTRLDRDIKNGALPKTSGFFFGQSTGAERGNDLEFVVKARLAIAQGKIVFYLAWW
jgi:hypothetical protein